MKKFPWFKARCQGPGKAVHVETHKPAPAESSSGEAGRSSPPNEGYDTPNAPPIPNGILRNGSGGSQHTERATSGNSEDRQVSFLHDDVIIPPSHLDNVAIEPSPSENGREPSIASDEEPTEGTLDALLASLEK
ncbi:hypothetical protein ACHAXT_006736 [Thalassiosira profunda]